MSIITQLIEVKQVAAILKDLREVQESDMTWVMTQFGIRNWKPAVNRLKTAGFLTTDGNLLRWNHDIHINATHTGANVA